ncbi:c2 domain-containing protein [Ditylenchus destructor]|uniref:C2 domain-containing protein n=1 Tax=Ditylenchus destructor TaxID=166010 RepID=A0AAD4QWN3_9BILA|nr:c2 domain-containing protein [Ditylenchus destructor]
MSDEVADSGSAGRFRYFRRRKSLQERSPAHPNHTQHSLLAHSHEIISNDNESATEYAAVGLYSPPTSRTRKNAGKAQSMSKVGKYLPYSPMRWRRKHFATSGKSIVSDVLKCVSSLPTVESLHQLECQEGDINLNPSRDLGAGQSRDGNRSDSSPPRAPVKQRKQRERSMGSVCNSCSPVGTKKHTSMKSIDYKQSKSTEEWLLAQQENQDSLSAGGTLSDGGGKRSPFGSPRKTLKNRVWDSIKLLHTRSRSKENADDDSRIGDRKRGDASIPMIKQNENALKQLNERPESMAKQQNGLLPKTVIDDTARRESNEESSDGSNEYVTFSLKIHLKEGHGLVIRDASGSSDPYVKVKYQSKSIYKTNTVYRSLNPNWDEEFTFLISDPTAPLQIEVYDFDRFMVDDFMGSSSIDLSLLKLFEAHELRVNLQEEGGNEDYMGYVHLFLTITPLTEKQMNEFNAKAVRGIVTEGTRKSNKAASVWLSAVNIVLVEAKLNQSPSSSQLPDAYVKFKLGNEKYKSKVSPKTYEPKWTEQFDLHIYDENFQDLDIMIHDRASNSVIGKCTINLKDFEREKTEQSWYQLEDDAGSILLLLTISGTSSSATVVDLNEYSDNREQIINKYDWWHSFRSVKDVGFLTVKVYKAEGLAAADINGKSDPFCVLELVNARLQTQTEYKTLNPEWNKLFTFAIKDIHALLEITVYDEDPNKKCEFLGKIAIPLLRIRNCEKRWYDLKDRKLTGPAKGRILLEMDILWNTVKAAIRTFNPREKKFVAQEPKFKRQMLVGSVNRLREFWRQVSAFREYIQSCLSWQSYPRSLTAFFCFVTFVYFVEPWHFPVILLIFFLRLHILKMISEAIENRFRRSTNPTLNNVGQISNRHLIDERNPSVDRDRGSREFSDDDMDDLEGGSQRRITFADPIRDRPEIKRSNMKSKPRKSVSLPSSPLSENGPSPAPPPASNDKSSLKDRLIAIHDTLAVIQNSLDFLASLLERIRNTFNFTVPYLSYLAIFVLCIAAVLLYFVPFRWIVMVWGINKFSKRLRNPHYIDNNELLDFLSRVPSDQELRLHYRSHSQDATTQKISINNSIENVDANRKESQTASNVANRRPKQSQHKISTGATQKKKSVRQ